MVVIDATVVLEPIPIVVVMPEEAVPMDMLAIWPGERFCGASLARAAKVSMFFWGAAAGLWVGCQYSNAQGDGIGSLRVDDANHARLAMLALRAVEPDGFCVVDGDGIHGHHGAG